MHVTKCNLDKVLLGPVLVSGFSRGPWSLGSHKGSLRSSCVLERLFIYLFIYLRIYLFIYLFIYLTSPNQNTYMHKVFIDHDSLQPIAVDPSVIKIKLKLLIYKQEKFKANKTISNR